MFRAVLLVLGSIAAVAFAQPLVYPGAKKGDVVDDYFGTEVPDPYRWLEDTDSPETAAWVKAEDALTSGYMDQLPDRTAFRDKLTELLNYERYSVPVWEGHRYVYRKNDGLQNQSVIYTLKNLSDTPVVLLDPNQFANEGTVAVSSTTVSEDSR